MADVQMELEVKKVNDKFFLYKKGTEERIGEVPFMEAFANNLATLTVRAVAAVDDVRGFKL